MCIYFNYSCILSDLLKILALKLGRLQMDFYTDFACDMVSFPSASPVKVLIALTMHSSWKKFDPFADAV